LNGLTEESAPANKEQALAKALVKILKTNSETIRLMNALAFAVAKLARGEPEECEKMIEKFLVDQEKEDTLAQAIQSLETWMDAPR